MSVGNDTESYQEGIAKRRVQNSVNPTPVAHMRIAPI